MFAYGSLDRACRPRKQDVSKAHRMSYPAERITSSNCQSGRPSSNPQARRTNLPKNNALIERLWSHRKPSTKDEPASLKDRIDLLISAMTACMRLALFLGFLALAFYLGAAQHIVTGVNLTDAFLLAALALALGFLALVIVVAGAVLVWVQINFLVTSAAKGNTTSHLTPQQKLWVVAFVAAVVIHTFGMPWIYLLGFRANGWRLWLPLGLSFLSASALAWGWDRIQELCSPRGEGAIGRRAMFDRIADGVSTAGFLWWASLTAGVLATIIDMTVVVVLGLIGGAFAVGFRLTVVTGRRVTPRWVQFGRRAMAGGLLISAGVALVLPAFNGYTGVAKAFQMVALSIPSATIDVSATNLRRLDRASEQQGLPLPVCRHADGSATLTDVRVLWHTLGNSGLVELWSEPTDPKQYSAAHRPRFQTSPYELFFQVLGWRGVRVPLENSGLVVTTGSNLHCFELSGLHFESNSATLSKEAGQDLAQQLTGLKDSLTESKSRDGKAAETPARLQIVGHADPRQRQKGTNEDLARQRANAVREAVLSWISTEAPQWSSMAITVRSEGAREQARKCEDLSPAENEACNAFNRRVVLQMTTAPAS